MRFQKINDNVIRCTMTQEEMRCQGINIDDLMDDRSKAEEFLQYVLTKARYEVDFVTSGDVLNVQLSVMKDGEVSMMISDDQNAAIRAIADQFKDKLREFSKALGANANAAAPITPQIAIHPAPGKKQDFGNDNIDNKQKDELPSNEAALELLTDVSYDFWTRLSSIDDCIRMAKALEDAASAPSKLYKYYGEYYICTHLDMPKSEVGKVIFTMSEYSDDVSTDSNEYLMVSEHGEVIIKENALHYLANI